jgi:hypothetical protein
VRNEFCNGKVAFSPQSGYIFSHFLKSFGGLNMAVTVPAWFDYKVYRANKIADLQANNYAIDTFNFGEKFASAGYEDNEEGLYRHFCDFGMSENISPNALFDANYYFQAKAADYFGLGEAKINQVTAAQVQFIKDAFASAGMSAWQHYTKFGMKEGIDPSVYFDTDKYWDAKLLQLQAEQPEAGWTRDGMIDFFKSQNLNPVSHYCSFGEKEGLTYEASSRAGVRQDLTTDADNLVGTMGASTIDDNGNVEIGSIYNDYFNAEVVKEGNTLQSEDILNGLGGSDTLYARVDVTHYEGEIEPTVKDVETILFRSQIGDGDNTGYYGVTRVYGDGLGDVYGNVGATIDADRISFTDETTRLYIGSDNSRADLTIEDLRHDSNVTTVRMADTDPGVDFYLYFDPQHLKAQDQTESGILELELIDVKNADLSGGKSPLTEQPFDKVSFGYRVNGKTQIITFDLTVSSKGNYTTDTANYDTLLTAFQEALAKYEEDNPNMKGVFNVGLGTKWPAVATTGNDTYHATGTHIVISSDEGIVFYDKNDTNQGWGVSTGNVPLVGGIVWDVNQTPMTGCPLIEVGIQLDNVGRVQWYDASPECLPDEFIFGSNAGDLQVGSMALRGGVERMDVTVDRGSWIKGLYSTNDTLRMVTVSAEDIDGDGKAGNVDNNGELIEQGQLFIGTWDGHLDDQGNPPTNLTWTDPARLLNADPGDEHQAPTGLKDVAVFDAADYDGQINIAAQITDDSYDKYLKSVDGIKGIDKWAPLTAFGDKFTYLTGSNNDFVNMTVAGDIAADVDFKMLINTGAGKDTVAFRYDGLRPNQDYNQKYMRNVDISTGDGDDHVWFYSQLNDLYQGSGSVNVQAGSGRDVVYANQLELSTGGADSDKVGKWNQEGGVVDDPAHYNAVFAFNTYGEDFTTYSNQVGIDGFNGARLNNNVLTGNKDFKFNEATFKDLDNASSLYVTVKFMGFKGEAEIAGFAVVDSKDGDYATVNGNTKVSAETINHAFIAAIESDQKAMYNHSLSDVLAAKDGAGHSLLIESLINGEFDNTRDLTLGFEVRDSQGKVLKTDGEVFVNAVKYTSTEYGYNGNDAYKGHNYSTDSQVVVEAGTGDDVIVLNENGYLKDMVTVSANVTPEYVAVRDVINLKPNFGNDTVFDFQTGVDKINVSSFGLEGTKAAGSIGTLNDDNVIVWNNKAKTLSEVQKLADDGTIHFEDGQDEGSLAVIALHDGMRYTFALAEKTTDDSVTAKANAEISILGSLTFDNNHTLAVGDFSTSNNLVDEPA